MHDDALPPEPAEKAPETVTVADMDALVVKYFDQMEEKERREAAVTQINKEISETESKLASYMKALNRKDYKHPRGSVSLMAKWRVNNPQTDADKAAFFNWLRERGIFDKYATVNNQALNSLYTAEKIAAIAASPEDALTFTIPGIGAPKLYEGINRRKGSKES